MTLSRRMNWRTPVNALARAREAALAKGTRLLDLTVSNPTAVGIDYPDDELAAILGRAARAPWKPEARGLAAAREALAQELSTPRDPVHPDDLLLTASTSEAYSFLFKLLANPGDEIVTHTPSYPLLDHLAGLEGVRLRHFPLHSHGGRWEVDPAALGASLTERSRAIVAIHPNNPTGAFLSSADQQALAEAALPLEAALISDEVFYDYALTDRPGRGPALASWVDGLAFSLGGLSKSAGLPHWKLGWIRIGGDPLERAEARDALELIADSYLSVSTPVQAALAEVLPVGRKIRASIVERLRGSLAALHTIVGTEPAIELLAPEGGWSAVLRVPRLATEERLALELLERGVVVQPGWFYDFPAEGHLVVSLLTPPEMLAEGARRIVTVIRESIGG
ncbi:MAG TPA: pyridoxal phosphate-dependent aminotransferase [Thermoanaerobaculia bacterium]|nr:pyridoxal phosphate-dependent aminotransferase [Thermoanaerobaculia bacterium]